MVNARPPAANANSDPPIHLGRAECTLTILHRQAGLCEGAIVGATLPEFGGDQNVPGPPRSLSLAVWQKLFASLFAFRAPRGRARLTIRPRRPARTRSDKGP
jgi:hypothetical protein